jgi:hypothetical protein
MPLNPRKYLKKQQMPLTDPEIRGGIFSLSTAMTWNIMSTLLLSHKNKNF